MTEEEGRALKGDISQLISRVESLCRKHGGEPDELPPASRKAYRFLKELDLGNLPIRAGGVPRTPQIHLKNVKRNREYLAGQLWNKLDRLLGSKGEMQGMRQVLGSHLSQLERLCAGTDSSPGALAGYARTFYLWLKFLHEPSGLEAYVQALDRARTALGGRHQPSGYRIHILNMASLCSRRGELLRVNIGYLYAGQEVWDAIVRSSLGQSLPQHSQTIKEYAHSEEYGEVLLEIDSFLEDHTAPARGSCHDLSRSFDRVNREYFGGSMERPRLRWNQIITSRKFGHYQRSTDTVVLSITLDQPGVPEFVVDFILYHELLHKKLAAPVVNGRLSSHSPEFRRLERQFKRFEEAKQVLQQLARR